MAVYLATAVTLSALFVWQRDVFPIKGRDWPVVMLLEFAQVSLVVVWCLRRIIRGFPCWASCELPRHAARAASRGLASPRINAIELSSSRPMASSSWARTQTAVSTFSSCGCSFCTSGGCGP
jgi:hypothetical protein